MSTADKLTYLNNTKGLIKQAIETKGVTVGNIPFRQYADKIALIETGGTAEPPELPPLVVGECVEVPYAEYVYDYAKQLYESGDYEQGNVPPVKYTGEEVGPYINGAFYWYNEDYNALYTQAGSWTCVVDIAGGYFDLHVKDDPNGVYDPASYDTDDPDRRPFFRSNGGEPFRLFLPCYAEIMVTGVGGDYLSDNLYFSGYGDYSEPYSGQQYVFSYDNAIDPDTWYSLSNMGYQGIAALYLRIGDRPQADDNSFSNMRMLGEEQPLGEITKEGTSEGEVDTNKA